MSSEFDITPTSASAPVHALLKRLEAERFAAIEQAASLAQAEDPTGTDRVSRIAHLQMAILAIRDELAAHEPKLGSGSETPLR